MCSILKQGLRLFVLTSILLLSAQVQAQPALPALPELPALPAPSLPGRDATQQSASPTDKMPLASTVALPQPELPPASDLPENASNEPDVSLPVLPNSTAQTNDTASMDELSLPPLPGTTPKDETFPVKPEPQKPAIDLADKLFGKKPEDEATQTQTGSDKEPEVATDAQAQKDDKADAKPKKKGFRVARKGRGSRSETGGKMHAYRSQILPDTIYMRKYPRGNRHLPQAQYEQTWDKLMYVTAARGDLNGLRALLNTGRTPDMRDDLGQTPLIVAVRYNRINSARVLLARGADPNAMDNAGNTALHYAIANNHFPMVEALMTMGAKPDLADSRGVTAQMIAEQTRNPIILAALGM